MGNVTDESEQDNSLSAGEAKVMGSTFISERKLMK
jgi:hypothetical protein